MVPAPPKSPATPGAAAGAGARIFLSTEWRDLLMLNYESDPALLQRFVPRGTELDSFDGITYISVVGLRFARTKLFGSLAIPFHKDFDEVNLRIYVRRNEAGELRRGVVFIKEIVSLPLITFVARTVYGENYATMPLRHSIQLGPAGGSVEYSWESQGRSFFICGAASGVPARAKAGSLEQFISEHYFGYTARRDGSTLEYRVTHEPWNIWGADNGVFEGDAAILYGAEFGRALARAPRSAFIADGSPVLVHAPRRMNESV
jgi:uncharacterized protein YqjF (DUF2071 family)